MSELYVPQQTTPELVVIDDNGNEVNVGPDEFWQYEHDARIDGVTIEEFEAMEGDALYDSSN